MQNQQLLITYIGYSCQEDSYIDESKLKSFPLEARAVYFT